MRLNTLAPVSLFVGLALLATPAFAQEAADTTDADAPAAEISADPTALPESGRVYLVTDTDSKRFADADNLGGTFNEGEAVTLLLQDGDMVRIRKGQRYGWVAATTLTAVAPERPSAPFDPSTLPAGSAPGGFDIERLQELLQQTESGL